MDSETNNRISALFLDFLCNLFGPHTEKVTSNVASQHEISERLLTAGIFFRFWVNAPRKLPKVSRRVQYMRKLVV